MVVALKEAIDRGVDVTIIIDAKVNQHTDKKGKFHPSFPREENLQAIRDAGIRKSHIIEREANPSDIQHNKFMVLLKETPLGGLDRIDEHLGRRLHRSDQRRPLDPQRKRGAGVQGLLELLTDIRFSQGGASGREHEEEKAFRTAVEALGAEPSNVAAIPTGITPIFSPRLDLSMLDLYVKLADSATSSVCMTLAFGISADLKQALVDNTDENHIVFLLLEKEDTPNARSSAPFVAINARNNVYKAWGAFLRDPVYQWRGKPTRANCSSTSTSATSTRSFC